MAKSKDVLKFEFQDGSVQTFPLGTDVQNLIDWHNLKRFTLPRVNGEPFVFEWADPVEKKLDDGRIEFQVLPDILDDVEKDLKAANILYELTGFEKGQDYTNDECAFIGVDSEHISVSARDMPVVRELLKKYD